MLNGCQTDEIGRSLVRALPKLAIVCWESVAEDSAARAFAVGFYAAVAERLQERDRYRARMRRGWPRLLSYLLPKGAALSLFGPDPEERAQGSHGARRPTVSRAQSPLTVWHRVLHRRARLAGGMSSRRVPSRRAATPSHRPGSDSAILQTTSTQQAIRTRSSLI